MLIHAMLETAEQSLNALVARDPASLNKLKRLDGNVIRVRCIRPEQSFLVWVSAQGFHLETDQAINADAQVEGTSEQFIRFLLSDKAQQERSLFQGELILSGDTALVQRLQALLMDLDPDWAGLFESLGGTLPVAVFSQLFDHLQGAGRALTGSVRADWQEYLQEEIRLLPGEYELKAFSGQIRTLRRDSDRLSARLQRLKQQADHLCSQPPRT